MIAIGVCFALFPYEILTIWAPNDPAVAEAGATSLRMIAVSLPFMAVGLILSQALYGAGANTFVMLVEGILHFGVLVPLSWFLGPHLGLGMEGIWGAAMLYVSLLGVAMGLKFAGKSWRHIRL
jgi:Na+-driven multidrug efflux pump